MRIQASSDTLLFEAGLSAHHRITTGLMLQNYMIERTPMLISVHERRYQHPQVNLQQRYCSLECVSGAHKALVPREPWYQSVAALWEVSMMRSETQGRVAWGMRLHQFVEGIQQVCEVLA